MDNLKEQYMKKIVRGNDFTLRMPVKKIVNGEQVSFPLTDCTDIAVHVVSKYKRTALPYTIDKESNDVLLADVDGTTLSLGTYALEVTGRLKGANWRSFEYEQFAIVDNNASSDITLGDEVISGALVILPPGESSLKPDIPPQKVKKRKQIMIGKAIRCKSCDVLDAENWYVFSRNGAFLLLPSGMDKDDMVVHYRPNLKKEYETLDNFELFQRTAEIVAFDIYDSGFFKWKVEKYSKDPTTGKFEVWLVYTHCPNTIKGMGTKYEYVAGRKVWNRTLNIGDVNSNTVVNLSNTRFSVYHKKSYMKSRNLRNESKMRKRKCLRWKRLNGIDSVSRQERPGLYRISLKDSNSSKKVSFDFYFRRIGNNLYPIKA